MLITEYLKQSFLDNKNNNLIITDNLNFSYEQCEHYSNFFAYEINMKTNSKIIPIIMEKGWEQVIAVLSVLKSGKAYLPINTKESIERILELIKICDAEVLLLNSNICCTAIENFKKLTINEESCIKNKRKFSENEILSKELDLLVYIIFTSGSTGLPKGVMINHKAVLNTLLEINKKFQVTSKDRILFLSDLNFDLSVYDILGSILAGASIIIPDKNKMNEPKYLAETIVKQRVTIWNSVPVLMEMIVSYLEMTASFPEEKKDFLSLRLVLLSGDWIPVTLPARIKNIFENAKVISLGGATEASIWSIMYEINNIDKNWKSIPYGKPLSGQLFCIFDENLEEIKRGQVGELYIGGKGLAEGYWRDKKNTEKNFIVHEKFGRLYKTGDSGRYMPDGNIEFLGRIDSQIKINGFRVELSAIESSLLNQENIDSAVVIPIKENDKKSCKGLVAYIKSNFEKLDSKKWFQMEKEVVYKIIENWKKTYKSILSRDKDNDFNISGWINSYTGHYISEEEMKEWVDLTAELILRSKPQRVLEVGCGTGLILFKIIDQIEKYTGCDFSDEIINYLESRISKNNLHQKVDLHVLAAHEISEIKNQYDTIIFNSVTQYFPTLNYMLESINYAISLIAPGGTIFIGDIRNYENIDHFYLNTTLYRLKNFPNETQINYELYILSLRQNELIISPKIFKEYFKKNPRVSKVEIHLKLGKYENEMNNFRYDVLIKVESNDKVIEIEPEKIIDYEEQPRDIVSLQKLLFTNKNDFLLIKNIPNRRIVFLDKLLSSLKNGKISELSWGSLNEIQNKILHSAIDPYSLKRIGQESGYKIIMTISEVYNMTKIDAIFYKSEKNNLIFNYEIKNSIKNSKKLLFNNPVKNKIINNLIVKTKNDLKKSLPYYMIPDRIIYLEEFPLSSNGKIDRKNLPFIQKQTEGKKDFSFGENNGKILSIFTKILENNSLSIHDSFRNNGGTSLEAVHAIAEIKNNFSVNVEIGNILNQNISIKEIVQTIEKELNYNK